MELPENFDPSSHPAFQGHWNYDTDQSATYDFLLVFHSNYSPISYHFQDEWQYLLNFPTRLVFNPPPGWEGFPWHFVTALGPEKQNKMMPVPECQ